MGCLRGFWHSGPIACERRHAPMGAGVVALGVSRAAHRERALGWMPAVRRLSVISSRAMQGVMVTIGRALRFAS